MARWFLLIPAALLVLLSVSCSDKDSSAGETPNLPGTASRYVPAQADLPGTFDPLPIETYQISDEIWARSGLFATAAEGQNFADLNGYVDGWQALFAPDGLIAGVVGEGRYYLTVETYLFETIAGATATYGLYEARYPTIAGTQKVTVDRVGNRSSGWSFVEGTLPGTDAAAIYHRIVFQRGNLVTVVQTYGAETLMTIDAAREIAILVDSRALGATKATEPTPILPRTPTPAGG